jgi:hypothetical protein
MTCSPASRHVSARAWTLLHGLRFFEKRLIRRGHGYKEAFAS